MAWSTAAAAVHNILQQPRADLDSIAKLPKISFEDDPLSFLGILVDTLQEWDRYSVDRGRFLLKGAQPAERLPVQGIDVRLGVQRNGKPVIAYGDRKLAKRVRKALNGALIGWEDLVTVRA